MRERTAGHSVPKAAPLLLVAASAGIALGCLRVLFPLVYGIYERGGAAPSAALTGLVFASPVLMAAIPRGRSGMVLAVGAAAAGRLAIQLVHPAPTWLAAVAAAAALVALVIAAQRAPGPVATGVALGVALDVAVLSAFHTWDPAWQDGAAGLMVAVAWGAVALAGAALRDGEPPASSGASRPTWALGPALLLWILFLANPAFIGSAAGIGPTAAAGATLAGCATLVATSSLRVAGRTRVWAAAVTISVGAAVVPAVSGSGVLPLVLLAQGACGLVLAVALRAPRTGRSGGAVGAALGMLAFAAIAFGYQLDVEQPLPFPRWLLPAAAGALLAVAALRGSARVAEDDVRRWVRPRLPAVIAVPLALAVLIPLTLAMSEPAAPIRAAGATIRILDWNVHGAVDEGGPVDPAGVAAVIAAQDPDLVVLQEVARGWPIHGGVDLAAWLSRALAMPYRWAPAADGQFGNVVLSRLPVLGSEAVALPYVGGPQHRSFLRVTLDAGEDRTLTVIGTHLQQRSGSDVGSVQAGRVLSAAPTDEATVIAGDLNAQPGDASLAVLTDAGFVSAQDAVGDPTSTTAHDPTTPGDRVDWIFVSPGLRAETFEIVASDASDHLPLITTLRLT